MTWNPNVWLPICALGAGVVVGLSVPGETARILIALVVGGVIGMVISGVWCEHSHARRKTVNK